MNYSNNIIEKVLKESDYNNNQVKCSDSLQLTRSSMSEDCMLWFKFSDNNIRNAIMKNAFSVLKNSWKTLSRGCD